MGMLFDFLFLLNSAVFCGFDFDLFKIHLFKISLSAWSVGLLLLLLKSIKIEWIHSRDINQKDDKKTHSDVKNHKLQLFKKNSVQFMIFKCIKTTSRNNTLNLIPLIALVYTLTSILVYFTIHTLLILYGAPIQKYF